MRIVAGFLLAVLLAASFSAPVTAGRLHAYDECDNGVTPAVAGMAGGSSCIRIELTSTPDPAKGKTGEYVFLWLGALDCETGPACVTTQRPPSSNVATGFQAIYGLVYLDLNGYSGLQRIHRNIGGTVYFADPVLLV